MINSLLMNIFSAIIACTAILPSCKLKAGENHHQHDTIINEYNTYNSYYSKSDLSCILAASNASANISAYGGSTGPQFMGAYSRKNECDAAFLAYGQNVNKELYLQFTINKIERDEAVGVGFTWLPK